VTTVGAQLVSVVYNPGTLQARWRPGGEAGVTGFRLVLSGSDGSRLPVDAGPTERSKSFPFTPKEQTAYQLTVSALINGQPGVISQPSPVLTAAPQMVQVSFDVTPTTGLTVRWRRVALPGVAGYAATLVDRGGGGTFTRSTQETTALFTEPLDVGQTYAVSVRATDALGISQGPPSEALQPILVAPTVSNVLYDAQPQARLAVRCAPLSGNGVEGFTATLTQEGGGGTWSASDSQPLLTFAQALDAGQRYRVSVRATARMGIVQGPPSAVYAPIAVAPAVTVADYDGQRVLFQLQAVPQPGVSSYLGVLSDGTNVRTGVSGTPEITFAGALVGTGPFTLTARAQSDQGIVQGPATPALTLLTAQPALTQLDYDTGALTPAWTAVTARGLVGYRVVVSGPQPQSFDVELVTSKTLGVTLAPGNPWLVVVRARGDLVLGPPSAALAPLLSPPPQARLAYTGALLRVTWSPSQETGVTGYLATLYEDSTELLQHTRPQSPLEHPLPALKRGARYTARVRATGDKVKGPWCPWAVGPAAHQLVAAYDAQGRLRTATINGTDVLTYDIDAAGNVRSVSRTPVPPGGA
jgi:hypothetical protein